MAEIMVGVVERVVFHNADNGYCVVRVGVSGLPESVSVVGYAPAVAVGECVTLEGRWGDSRVYGRQFEADKIESSAPRTIEGIVKYLSSGIIKGVGVKSAERIVGMFGERTLEVIEKSPKYLLRVSGLGASTVSKIVASWEEHKASRAIMVFLHSHGITAKRAAKIYKHYGESTIDTLTKNPYRLAEDVVGIGFALADDFALRLGVPRDSPVRAAAAVRHVVLEAAQEGHVGLPPDAVVGDVYELTQIGREKTRAAIEQLVADDLAIVERGLVYPVPLYMAETNVAGSVCGILSGPHPLELLRPPASAVAWAAREMGIAFSPSQREALEKTIVSKACVITGGPGTGKTTIVRAVLDIFRYKRLGVLLCAPTGRAAKRLSEATGQDAYTIHRLLQYDGRTGTFKHGAHFPLTADLIVVDEASMVDVVLMNRLMQAVRPETAVLFVGDRDQLPSVGPGSILADLINSGVMPVARLTEVHRQAEASAIVRAARCINQGRVPDFVPAGEKGDFYFVEANEPERAVEVISALVTKHIPERFGLHPTRDIQVLTPQKKTALGVLNLNAVLQGVLNPQAFGVAEVTQFGRVYRVGDKVMHTKNNYPKGVFNGDVGIVSHVSMVNQELRVDYDGREVEYDFEEIEELTHAYACSVHKSQGSEYPAVVIPVHTQHFGMLQRNLLYTGVTRGRKLVVLVGERRAVRVAVETTRQCVRHTRLRDRLAESAAHVGNEEGHNLEVVPFEKSAVADSLTGSG